MRVAAVSWSIRPIAREEEFYAHLSELVGRAAEARAELIVLPELPVLELLALEPNLPQDEIAPWLASHASTYRAELSRLERETGALIVGGSHIEGRRNVCSFGSRVQSKNVLTQWELSEWGLEPGAGMVLYGGIGVTICYDVEFPLAGRAVAEAGAKVLCVPSFTETQHGFQRVRWSSQARAIENQIFVVHASLVGSLGREPVPSTYGSSAILTPSVPPFPESAILAETPFGEEGFAVAELEFDDLRKCREEGDVRNWHDRDKGDWAVRELPLS